MSEIHYALGLDIGIDSVGWAVLRNDMNGEPDKIENLGVREPLI
jgi:CRISPR/Cas system Type II protein with McrA/HNH and RuvC-like nuclease domain